MSQGISWKPNQRKYDSQPHTEILSKCREHFYKLLAGGNEEMWIL